MRALYMSSDTEFRGFVLDQLQGMGTFETRNMFGGTAILREGVAFAKIKHGSLWLKADSQTIEDFSSSGMQQYTYGKDNSRRLNFWQTPVEVLEDPDRLIEWAEKACRAAFRSKGVDIVT
jgi:DNA transformation protein